MASIIIDMCDQDENYIPAEPSSSRRGGANEAGDETLDMNVFHNIADALFAMRE